MSESADTPRDPNYILSQAEFHQNVGVLLGAIDRAADDLRQTAGWLFVSLAFWLLLAGYSLLRGGHRAH